jgi:hypothetical protein
MSAEVLQPGKEVVRLDLDFATFELGADECEELVRLLRRRGAQPGGEPASIGANRFEAVLRTGRGAAAAGDVSDAELDALADAAWDWLRSSGPDATPERVLFMLDTLRSRHAHD